MRYQKPMVMDLSAGARATGQDPLACISGNTPGGTGDCEMGTSGFAWADSCGTGPNPGTAGMGIGCVPGSAANYCLTGPGGEPYWEDCTSGPTPTTPG